MSQHPPVNPVKPCAKKSTYHLPLFGSGLGWLFFFRCVATPFNESITSASSSFTILYNKKEHLWAQNASKKHPKMDRKETKTH
jgi:hypothetical protein